MLEAVEGALSAGSARGDALCALCAGGFALYAGASDVNGPDIFRTGLDIQSTKANPDIHNIQN